ncbi:MAG: cadmium-containing carbonic anhydrase [Candidatus Saccharibacteria bacterium]|nr:cadmium-containing carbonic anhydrase [Candidatus Saccharibacteria bacterium]
MAEFYSQASSSDEAQSYRGNDEKTASDCYEQPIVSYQLGDEYGLGKLNTPECPHAAEFIQELGEHYVPAVQNIIGVCMDGRPGSTAEAVPNGAGGGLLYLVTDRLVRGNSDAINEANARVLGRIGQIPATVHVHRDDHAHGEDAGCAAADKVGAIFTIIAQHGEQLRSLATKLGLGSDSSDEAHQQIIRHAADESKLVMASGNDLVAMVDAQLAKSAEPTGAHTDTLHGNHHEVAVVMNQRTGTTLDRQSLAREFDQQYQAFNIDTWAFAPSAEALYPGDPTAQQYATTAMLYYNLAAIMALCGPRMTVTVLT